MSQVKLNVMQMLIWNVAHTVTAAFGWHAHRAFITASQTSYNWKYVLHCMMMSANGWNLNIQFHNFREIKQATCNAVCSRVTQLGWALECVCVCVCMIRASEWMHASNSHRQNSRCTATALKMDPLFIQHCHSDYFLSNRGHCIFVWSSLQKVNLI